MLAPVGDLYLLLEHTERRRCRHAALRTRVRSALGIALREILPSGWEVWVFGSLCEEGRFSAGSDVDVALEKLPKGISIIDLTAELSERLAREVDVVPLAHSRFSSSIREKGERWIV